MNDNTKTLIFVLVAVVILLLAWVFRPRIVEERPEEIVGDLLVPDFDPLKAASLEILKYDEKQARVESFQVAHDKNKGVWSIPSHDNYPADAKEHLAEAATGLLGVKILQVVSQEPGDHEQFGVLDPDPQNPRKGMGLRVVMKDKEGKELLALIIGKEVPGDPELRYVRRVGQDLVVVAPVKTDKLSTRFEDWIEKDLLKLNPWDIKEIKIRDYSVDIVRGIINQRGEMTLEYNDTGDPRWKLLRDDQGTDQGVRKVTLADDEELNIPKLDDMKFALDDLKIVDVNPKPPGLSADLKAEETLITNKEAVANLAARGFYPAQVEDRYEIVSNEGEIRVLMKDGVEYLLRFGGPAGTGETTEASKPTDKPEPSAEKLETEEKKTPGMNRFIMVTAKFNESAIPKPELQPLPGESGEKPPAEPKPESKPAAPGPEAKTDPKPNSAPSEKTDPAQAQKPENKKDSEQAKKELEQRRQEIEKENQRKVKEYQEKLEQGRKKAKELNDRFADWYYIISEDTYKKIHLSRHDIIKKKEKEEKPKQETGLEHPHQPEIQSKETEKPQGPPEAKQPASKEVPESKPAEPATPKPGPAEPGAPKPGPAEPAIPKPGPASTP